MTSASNHIQVLESIKDNAYHAYMEAATLYSLFKTEVLEIKLGLSRAKYDEACANYTAVVNCEVDSSDSFSVSASELDEQSDLDIEEEFDVNMDNKIVTPATHVWAVT